MSTKPSVVGTVQIRPLSDVKPNPWNPNRMTARTMESLKHGITADGWLASQSLLIWGADADGVQRDLIIDGEHRYRAALELGFTTGPMVVLDGLSEAKAKALTIKMNQKRGEFDAAELADLVASISDELGAEDLALDLGFNDEDVMKMLAGTPDEIQLGTQAGAGAPAAQLGTSIPVQGDPSKLGYVKLVQLFFGDAKHVEWLAMTKDLAARFGTTNVTDTAFEAVKRAWSAGS